MTPATATPRAEALWGGFTFDEPLRIAHLEAFVLRAPLAVPRKNAFGDMSSRPALLVRLTTDTGEEGWGEGFCNWPPFAAEHRRRIVNELLDPLCRGTSFASPVDLFEWLNRKTDKVRLQSGEHGPFRQSIAAIDLAAWDVYARRKRRPLAHLLNPDAALTLPLYASALAPNNLDACVGRAADLGVHAFKLKVGFGLDRDLDNLRRLRAAVGHDATIMVDANQAWHPDEAAIPVAALAEAGASWIEEPLPANVPQEAWQRLRASTGATLAAGENVAGWTAFGEHLDAGALDVVQPDLIKWGGVTMGYPLAKRILAQGKRYCPHYLGGGVGLAATAHVMAAVGDPDLLEFDLSENPLQALAASFRVQAGALTLANEPGLGALDSAVLDRYVTSSGRGG